MTILFEDYLNEVRPDVPGCPEATMENAVRNACIELCEKALIWRETLAAIDSVVGTDQYTLSSADAEAAVHMPIYVAYDTTPLDGYSEEELDIIDYGWRTAGQNIPSAYLMVPGGILWFNRKPAVAITGGIVTRVAIKPKPDAIGADDFLYNDWHEAIAHGAKRRLMEVEGKKWSNPKSARFHGAKFNFFVQDAHARATKGNIRKSTTAKMIAW